MDWVNDFLMSFTAVFYLSGLPFAISNKAVKVAVDKH